MCFLWDRGGCCEHRASLHESRWGRPGKHLSNGLGAKFHVAALCWSYVASCQMKFCEQASSPQSFTNTMTWHVPATSNHVRNHVCSPIMPQFTGRWCWQWPTSNVLRNDCHKRSFRDLCFEVGFFPIQLRCVELVSTNLETSSGVGFFLRQP